MNPIKNASRAKPLLETETDLQVGAYETPSLVEVGNLRELLGKSGAESDPGFPAPDNFRPE